MIKISDVRSIFRTGCTRYRKSASRRSLAYQKGTPAASNARRASSSSVLVVGFLSSAIFCNFSIPFCIFIMIELFSSPFLKKSRFLCIMKDILQRSDSHDRPDVRRKRWRSIGSPAFLYRGTLRLLKSDYPVPDFLSMLWFSSP